MASERNFAQVEEMRKRGYILVSEAARRAKVHPGCIYRDLESERLSGTEIGTRKYVEWESFVAAYKMLAGDINVIPAGSDEEEEAPKAARRKTTNSSKPKRAPQRSRQ